MSIINSIPAEWRSAVKTSTDLLVIDPLPSTPTIRMESDNLVPILDASSKQIYQLFLRQKKTDSTHCQTEINQQVPEHCNQLAEGLFVSLPNHFRI